MKNLLKKIKKYIMKKSELEQQLSEAINIAQKLGNENKQLLIENTQLKNTITQLRNDFNSAAERVRYLVDEVKMLETQKSISSKYSTSGKNY